MPIFKSFNDLLPLRDGDDLITGPKLFSDLVLNVVMFQEHAKFKWITSHCCEDSSIGAGEFGGLVSGEFVIDETGATTLIPSYVVYDRLWRDDVNPFTKNWLQFRSDEHWLRYLERVIDTLDEQIVLWRVDDVTKETLLFLSFVEFTSNLNSLYTYCLNAV